MADPFDSISKHCRISSSQEELLRDSPSPLGSPLDGLLASLSASSNDSNVRVSVDPSPIWMLTPPTSDDDDEYDAGKEVEEENQADKGGAFECPPQSSGPKRPEEIITGGGVPTGKGGGGGDDDILVIDSSCSEEDSRAVESESTARVGSHQAKVIPFKSAESRVSELESCPDVRGDSSRKILTKCGGKLQCSAKGVCESKPVPSSEADLGSKPARISVRSSEPAENCGSPHMNDGAFRSPTSCIFKGKEPAEGSKPVERNNAREVNSCTESPAPTCGEKNVIQGTLISNDDGRGPSQGLGKSKLTELLADNRAGKRLQPPSSTRIDMDDERNNARVVNSCTESPAPTNGEKNVIQGTLISNDDGRGPSLGSIKRKLDELIADHRAGKRLLQPPSSTRVDMNDDDDEHRKGRRIPPNVRMLLDVLKICAKDDVRHPQSAPGTLSMVEIAKRLGMKFP